MKVRDWTETEIRRGASILWPGCDNLDLAIEAKKVVLRALNAGMQLPPDPVREKIVACIREVASNAPWCVDAGHFGRSLYGEMADAILARFNVTPKGGGDA